MAARFPQSTTSVAYRIKPAWASKVHAIWWAADADKLHRLKSGDSATTIITRSASGAGFDATNGVITGANDTNYFTDSIAGGYGALREDEVKRFAHRRDAQGFALAIKENGECVYLTHRGCSVHGAPPDICRRFDCRVLFLSTPKSVRRQRVEQNPTMRSVYEAGKIRASTLGRTHHAHME